MISSTHADSRVVYIGQLKMQFRQFTANTFVGRGLRGNPAAVCLLDQWLDDATMLRIAEQNRYSETAFVLQGKGTLKLRWFTPLTEIDLCGHATLAAAYILATQYGKALVPLEFATRSGTLSVTQLNDIISIKMPARSIVVSSISPKTLAPMIGHEPMGVFEAGPTVIALLATPSDVQNVVPAMDAIASIPKNGLIVTAAGGGADFSSRFFAPRIGMGEDPATGAAHTGLGPFWAQRLNKSILHARQLSARGGELFCSVFDDIVEVGGRVELFSEGVVTLGSGFLADE